MPLSRHLPCSLVDWTQTQGQVRAGYTHLFSHNSAFLDERDTCREQLRKCTLLTLFIFSLGNCAAALRTQRVRRSRTNSFYVEKQNCLFYGNQKTASMIANRDLGDGLSKKSIGNADSSLDSFISKI